MDKKPVSRRSIFAVWHWPKWALAASVILLILPTGYLTSQAPLARLDRDTRFARRSTGRPVLRWAFYQPADWVYDHTALRQPLRRWADLWGMRHEVGIRSQMRLYTQNFFDEPRAAVISY